MILHRFMSRAEYEKYKAGVILVNTRDHHAERGEASTAKGFCWFVDDPEVAKHRLNGIVDMEICLTVKVGRMHVQKCKGRYPNWVAPGVAQGSVFHQEWCCTEYDNTRFNEVETTEQYYEYGMLASVLRSVFKL